MTHPDSHMIEGDIYEVPIGSCRIIPFALGVVTGHRSKPYDVTDILCPYCGERLIEAHADDARRVVRIVSQRGDVAVVIGQRIPDTHRNLACTSCRVSFTSLKPEGDKRCDTR